MKTYRIITLAKTETIDAVSVDESDPHVVRFVQDKGRPKSYGRGTLVSYEAVLREQDETTLQRTPLG